MRYIYCHEHITVDLSREKHDPDCRLADEDATVAEMLRLKELGVYALIDQTNRGMGRNTDYAETIAGKTGVRILHATGFYKEPFFPAEVYALSEKQLCALMVDEIVRGIGETRIRANHIGEVGTGKEAISPAEEKVLRAAAAAQRETGVSVVTHTSLGSCAMEQYALFHACGVPENRLVLSHVQLARDADYLLRVADLGVFLSFDTIGKSKYQPTDEAVDFLVLLRERGYLSQVMLSMDITRKSHLKINGGPGYAYLIEVFLPLLKARGFADDDIEQMMWRNPIRAFGSEEKGL